MLAKESVETSGQNENVERGLNDGKNEVGLGGLRLVMPPLCLPNHVSVGIRTVLVRCKRTKQANEDSNFCSGADCDDINDHCVGHADCGRCLTA
jgi:hypothetical protein